MGISRRLLPTWRVIVALQQSPNILSAVTYHFLRTALRNLFMQGNFRESLLSEPKRTSGTLPRLNTSCTAVAENPTMDERAYRVDPKIIADDDPVPLEAAAQLF